MIYNLDNVPDPVGWTVIDARTGLEAFKNDPRHVVMVDDERHLIEFQEQRPLHPHLWECEVFHVPRIIVNVSRKTILIHVLPPEELNQRDFARPVEVCR